MAAYMRDQFEYFGIKSTPRKAAQRDIERAIAKEPIDTVVSFAQRCWSQDEREFQYTACEVLRRSAKRLEPGHLDKIRALIVDKPWWDTVDALAGRTVGPLVLGHDLGSVMDEWIDDENMWVVRTALLHQLFYKEATDDTRLFDYCTKQMHHQDFFIRKAIGWALRQYAYTDADAVLAFVRAHEVELSGLSKREALKHIG